VFDLDGSGSIDADELRKIVKATNMASEKQLTRKVEWLMKQCDTDGDGMISYDEFVNLSKKFPNIVFPAYSLASGLGGLSK
jgi:serine/threonine-protein phosphatase 2B regulatory subunit